VRVKQAADISTPGLNQRALHVMLERGILAQQLERNNRELPPPPGCRPGRRRAIFSTRYTLECASGGLYLWVQLPKTGPTAAELYVTAAQMGVTYAIGSIFHTNSCGAYHVRLNYGSLSPADIEQGFRRLGRAWREVASDYAEIEKMPVF